MSLVSTLAKVALGVAIAKGASYVARNGLPTGGSASGAGTGAPYGRGTVADQAPGGLGDLMKSVLGDGAVNGRPTKMPDWGPDAEPNPGRAQGPVSGGGLGGLLEQLAGQSTSTRTKASKAPSGIEDLLGRLTDGSGGAAGGLGGLLGGLLGGPSAGSAASGGIGGLGTLFNDAISGRTPATDPTAHQEVAAAVMLKAMVQAAKSDGKLDDAEKAKLMQNLGSATRQEIAFVNDLLAQPVDVNALVDEVPRGLEEQVYLMSLMAIDLDSRNEAAYLHELATGLGLPRDAVNSIHTQAGAPVLYS